MNCCMPLHLIRLKLAATTSTVASDSFGLIINAECYQVNFHFASHQHLFLELRSFIYRYFSYKTYQRFTADIIRMQG